MVRREEQECQSDDFTGIARALGSAHLVYSWGELQTVTLRTVTLRTVF